MILIADSGSTKTDWCCIQEDGTINAISTIGLNPNFTNEDFIFKTIEALPYQSNSISEIHFYGSGCGSTSNITTLQDALLYKYPNAATEVVDDLLGAARACLHNEPGVIAILGTGSNSGVYDGKTLSEGLPSLGYLLGDYGGGVDIGKRLLRDFFYNKMPSEISADMQITREELMQRLYHEPRANTFIASQAKVVYQHAGKPYIRSVVKSVLNRFISEEIMEYSAAQTTSINFVGSIAFLFKDILEEVLEQHHLTLGRIIQKPISALTEYHKAQNQ